MTDAAKTLEQAMQLHRGGNLAAAKQAYSSIPVDSVQHVDALHLLGVCALQEGRAQDAVNQIQAAIKLKDNVPAMYSNLAEAFRAMRRHAEAIESCRKALELDPKYHACRANMALALTELGKLDEGENELREVLKHEPNNALAHNNLANNLRLQNRMDEALAEQRTAVRLEPSNPESLSNLGQLLLEDGDPEEALPYLKNAVKLNPNFAAAHSNLGNVLRELGQLDDAEAAYNKALQLRPELAITHNNMGQLWQQRGDFDQALGWYKRSLDLDPRAARTVTNLASALNELERDDEALALYTKATELQPNYAEAYIGIAGILKRKDDPAGASGNFGEALKHKPQLAAAHLGLANIYSEQGNFEAAEKSARQALHHQPRAAGAYERLVSIHKKKLPAEDVKGMKALLEASYPLGKGALPSLHFAIATWADSSGSYAEASRHLEEANKLQHDLNAERKKTYDPDEHTKFVDDIIRVFEPKRFHSAAGWGNDSEVPVFVLGLPRSGTTLAEQVLASHSRVFGADELRLARESFFALPGALNKDVSRIEAIEQLTEEAIQKVAADHLDKLRARAPESDRIVDKMPENYLNIGVIKLLFPKARIIHMRRDLRDIATSSWITHFGQIRWANRKEHITNHYRNYWRVMDHWREVLKDEFIEVRYEDMVDDLEANARRMLDYCGLDWEPNVLDFHENKRPVKTASVAQVREPLYNRSVARWKRYEEQLGDWYSELDQIQSGDS